MDLEAEEEEGVRMTAWGQIPATEHAARACGRIQVELPVHGEKYQTHAVPTEDAHAWSIERCGAKCKIAWARKKKKKKKCEKWPKPKRALSAGLKVCLTF